MSYRLTVATVRESRRAAIYVVRIDGTDVDEHDVGEVAERMREKLESRGEIAADVVVVQGGGKETLRLHGSSYSVSKVRAAMFNAAISWQPIDLD
jgi:translation initiation factor 1 (eIF-1/SUI1)